MKVLYTEFFGRQIKKHIKKFPKLLKHLQKELLTINPYNCISLGGKKYKTRVSILSISKGKSGSFRLIFFYLLEKDTIIPIALYQKSECENLSKKEILQKAKLVQEELKDFFNS